MFDKMGCASSDEAGSSISIEELDQIANWLHPEMLVATQQIGEPAELIRHVSRAPCGSIFLDKIPLRLLGKWMLVSMAHVGFPVGTNPETCMSVPESDGNAVYDTNIGGADTLGHPYSIARNSNMAYVIDHIGTVPDTRAVLKVFNLTTSKSRIHEHLNDPQFVAANDAMVCVIDKYVTCTTQGVSFRRYLLKIFNMSGHPVCFHQVIGRPRHLEIFGGHVYVVEQAADGQTCTLKIFGIANGRTLRKYRDIALPSYRDMTVSIDGAYIVYGNDMRYQAMMITNEYERAELSSDIVVCNPWLVAVGNDIRSHGRMICIIDYDGNSYLLKVFIRGNMTIVQHAFQMPVRMVTVASLIFILDNVDGRLVLKIFTVHGYMIPTPPHIRKPVDIAVGSLGVSIIDKERSGFKLKSLDEYRLMSISAWRARDVRAYILVVEGTLYVVDTYRGIVGAYNSDMCRTKIPNLYRPIDSGSWRNAYIIDAVPGHNQNRLVVADTSYGPFEKTYMGLHLLHIS